MKKKSRNFTLYPKKGMCGVTDAVLMVGKNVCGSRKKKRGKKSGTGLGKPGKQESIM